MGQIDHPAARDSLLTYEQKIEEPVTVHRSDMLNSSDAAPLVPARGIINGVLLGVILWAAILWTLF
jgi:hypothetical protein